MLPSSCLLSHNYIYCHRYNPQERAGDEWKNILAQRYRMMGRAPEAAGALFFTSTLVPEPFITPAALALLARQ